MNPIADTPPLPEKVGFDRPSSGFEMPEARYRQLREQSFGPESGSSIPEPVTTAEKVAHSVGEDTPMIAGGAMVAPLFAPAAPVMAVLGEMGLGTLGSGVAHSVEQAGGSVPTQIGAEVLATAAAPLAAPTRIAKRVGTAMLRDASEGAMEAAAAVAAKHGVSPEAVMRASSELKRKIARGIDDPEKYVRKASDQLGQDIEAFGDVTPTLSQSVGEYGGSNISSMELNWAKADQDFAADALGRRLEVDERLQADFNARRPAGSVGAATEGFQAARTAAVNAERKAWEAVPIAEMPLVDMSGVQEVVARMRRGPKASRRYLPKEASIIEGYKPQASQMEIMERGRASVDSGPAMATMAEVQALRSELLDTQRAGSVFGASDVARRRAKRVAPILDALQKEIDKIPDAAGGAEYRAAREMTRRNARLFNPSAKAVDSLMTMDDPKRIVSRIMGSRRKVDEVRNVIEAVGNDPETMDGLRAIFWDELFGPSLGDRTVKQMNASLAGAKRDVYRELYGEDGMKFIDELIRRQRTAASGITGTTAQARATGTGQAAIDQLLSIASDAKNPAWALATRSGRYLANKALSREEIVILLRNATQDIRLAKALLDMPTTRAEPAWRVVMDQSIARAKDQARKTAARNAARRQAGEDGTTP